MLTDDVHADTAAELERQYADALAGAVEDAGEKRVREETGLDAESVEAVRSGETDVELSDAAAVLAVDDERTADGILTEVRDVLLFGMTSAVLDVETLAADVDDLEPGEVQAMVEGRLPMTVGEYARLRYRIERR